eukprot:1991839-Rhodomonas_salina.2
MVEGNAELDTCFRQFQVRLPTCRGKRDPISGTEPACGDTRQRSGWSSTSCQAGMIVSGSAKTLLRCLICKTTSLSICSDSLLGLKQPMGGCTQRANETGGVEEEQEHVRYCTSGHAPKLNIARCRAGKRWKTPSPSSLQTRSTTSPHTGQLRWPCTSPSMLIPDQMTWAIRAAGLAKLSSQILKTTSAAADFAPSRADASPSREQKPIPDALSHLVRQLLSSCL